MVWWLLPCYSHQEREPDTSALQRWCKSRILTRNEKLGNPPIAGSWRPPSLDELNYILRWDGRCGYEKCLWNSFNRSCSQADPGKASHWLRLARSGWNHPRAWRPTGWRNLNVVRSCTKRAYECQITQVLVNNSVFCEEVLWYRQV